MLISTELYDFITRDLPQDCHAKSIIQYYKDQTQKLGIFKKVQLILLWNFSNPVHLSDMNALFLDWRRHGWLIYVKPDTT